MNIRKPLSIMKKYYINKLGFHTSRKILVIESDDWGSIRMPSRAVYDKLLKQGDPVNNDAFLRNDSLESPEDLNQLFATLSKYRDSNGKNPCITANYAVANPRFISINPKKNIYEYEVFTNTYNKYGYDSVSMLKLIHEGIERHLFKPQLHAREHLNVSRWMNSLKKNNPDVILAFENNMIGTGNSFTTSNRFGYMDSLNYDSKDELHKVCDYISEATDIFESIFGYRSKTFVASCFVWTSRIEKCLSEKGIRLIQTQFRQNICPFNGTTIMLGPYHYTGQKNKWGQYYTLRNCEYEPSYDNQYERRAHICISRIEEAFENKKPAIINSHRMNYIGSINYSNLYQGLKGLDIILKTITEKYPQIEFLSTDELLDVMEQEDVKK